MGDTNSILNPISPGAEGIATLFYITIGIGAIIVIGILAALIYFMTRFRARPGEGEPTPIYGLPQLEVIWTVGPILLLTLLMGITIAMLNQIDPLSSVEANQQADIEIIGHQWWWEIRYPKANVITANEIHLPANKPMLARFEGADVIHDFWVPQLGRKMDTTPGHPTWMYLNPVQEGVYTGACAEYCGTEHAWMRIWVRVESQDKFNAWLQSEAQNPPAPASGNAAEGAKIFTQETCVNCHVIGTTGKAVGPNLTHVGSRNTLGSGILQNTPENMAKWLTNPQAVKPGVMMPNLQLTDQEVRDLTAYLESLK
jgi:cytochrome c oxidase subunit 2